MFSATSDRSRGLLVIEVPAGSHKIERVAHEPDNGRRLDGGRADPVADDGSLWSYFLSTVERRGPAVALDFGHSTLSFDALQDLALRAATFLVQHGIGRGDVVALQVPKRVSTYALMLGCLRLGAIYTPFDPANPPERTQRMLARVRPKLLIASVGAATGGAQNPFGAVVVADHDGGFDVSRWPQPLAAVEPRLNLQPADPAYVMFTSGSTGEPKGAVIPQQGVRWLMRWAGDLLGTADRLRFSAINPLHFDNSVFDFYCGLVAGGTLVPVEVSEDKNPMAWAATLAQRHINVLFSVPTLTLLFDKVGVLTPAYFADLKHIMFGGEGFPVETLRTVHDRFRGHAQLINVYGPTETSCICSSLVIDDAALAAADGAYASLGRMHPGFGHAVLDEDGRAVASGEAGELWIGGPCVGLGYYGNTDETARRFFQDPRQSAYRSMFYRSGDLVREDAAGMLWFIGRRDNQVKIAGHRIELEEIDYAVQSADGVRRSLTAVLQRGDATILATAYEADVSVLEAHIAAHLSARLPAYMRPVRLLRADALPLNSNGKVDRLAVKAQIEALFASEVLPAAVGDGDRGTLPSIAVVPADAVSASTGTAGTRAIVAQAWRQALALPDVPDDVNFFDLGGTSLAMVHLHAHLVTQVNVPLSLTDLFARPTIAQLTDFIDGNAGSRSNRLAAARNRGVRQRSIAIQMAVEEH